MFSPFTSGKTVLSIFSLTSVPKKQSTVIPMFSIIDFYDKIYAGGYYYVFHKRFVLDLSFIGWFILTGITIGLAGIYVLPYYYAAQVHFYEALKTDMHIRQASYFNQFNQTAPEPTQPSEPTTTETVSEHVVEDTIADTLVDTAVENTAEQQMDSAIDSPLDHKE